MATHYIWWLFQPSNLFAIVEPTITLSCSTTDAPRYKFITRMLSPNHRLNRPQQRRRGPAGDLEKWRVETATAGNPLVEATRVERPDVSYAYEYTGVLRGVAPELRAIPVSPRWGKTLKRERRPAKKGLLTMRRPHRGLACSLMQSPLGTKSRVCCKQARSSEKWRESPVTRLTSLQ